MKKKEVTGICRFLAGLKLSKFSKEVRSGILSNHLKLYRIASDIDKDIQEIQKKLLEGKEDEVQKLQAFRTEYQSCTDETRQLEIVNLIKTECAEVLAIESELTQTVEAMLDESVDVDLTKLDRDSFVEGLVENDIDFSPADIIVLSPILN